MTDYETTPGGREVEERTTYVGAGRELRLARIEREEGKYPRFVIQERPRRGGRGRWSPEQTVTGATLDNRLTGMKPEDEVF